MTEKEKLMYDILGKISGANVPIVFKGALITKLILAEQGFNKISRMTRDIDANWVEAPPEMPVLADTINRSLGDLREMYAAEISRPYGEKQSAGISIKERNTGDEIISMDIDMKPLIGSKTYYLENTGIKGVLANEILADKILTISGEAVYKHRAKDVIDVFALSHCVKISTKEIYEVCKKTNREIQSFHAFYNRKPDVEHAYNKLRGIEGKPAFDAVYSYLLRFIEPFAQKEYTDKIWNVETLSWRALQSGSEGA